MYPLTQKVFDLTKTYKAVVRGRASWAASVDKRSYDDNCNAKYFRASRRCLASTGAVLCVVLSLFRSSGDIDVFGAAGDS